MKKPNNQEELLHFIDNIPQVKEFMENFPVQMRDIILERRLELGWTQAELARQIKAVTGHPMTQATISRLEGGTPGITADTFDKVLKTLGMKKIQIEFGETPLAPDQGKASISSSY
ncbi:helix-turn-helix transcriptional regulator [Hazenella sp. IB182357]|uniref:Helix-turn-helix transcriptional regulator n=1 Tax=Polycladospora coralii TaxID=2771432 RepID=A0A926NC41_9BACL|nr:helix-turn-helix transcriptional regulator [Polycladospora coralii]MBD1373075.1 helix-turn-helix transcriptional regulator [Polycladospora coralii]MBS7529579.1 helix-turn-helix transcriptional regulator [Polycladospora coralii]